MNWIRRTISNTMTNNVVQLNVYIDGQNSINRDNFPYITHSNATLGQIKQEIALQKNYNVNGLSWCVYDQSDDSLLRDVVEYNFLSNSMDVHLIYTAEQFEKRDSLRNTSEINIQIDDDANLNKSTHIYPVKDILCLSCKKMWSKEDTITLFLCHHIVCKTCCSLLIMNLTNGCFKCPISQCPEILFDYEIQIVLEKSKYELFQQWIRLDMVENNEFLLPKIGWICSSCTYLNRPFLEFCDACSNNKPDHYIVPKYWEPTNEDIEILLKKQESDLLAIKTENEAKRKEDEEKLKNLEKLKVLARQQLALTTEVTECPICLIDCEPGEAVILHSCFHTICKECFRNYLVNVSNAQINCPTENCAALVEDREISAILSDEEYMRYQELSLRMAEAKEKNSFHCKEVNCIGWVTYEGILRNFKCPCCGKENCIPCNAIHEGKTCRQYLQSKPYETDSKLSAEDNLFIKEMIESGEAMKCPGCGILVQKTRGCDGVTCKSCGIMMCWATKGPRWGPKGKGDTSGGCGCQFFWGKRCHPSCHYCH